MMMKCWDDMIIVNEGVSKDVFSEESTADTRHSLSLDKRKNKNTRKRR